MSSPVTAAFVIIGNEILSGRTQDTNLAYVAQGLDRLGIRMREVRVVPDIEEEIVAAVNMLRAQHDYVFTSGGIGPTHDDITSASIAKAFGVDIVRDPEAVRALQSHYPADALTPARLKMAEVPAGAVLIDNPVSKAPGFQIGNVFVMAGVPSILQAMFDGLRQRLTGGAPLIQRSISSSVAEGAVAADLEAIQLRFPDVEIGSYPYFRGGMFGTALVLRATDEVLLSQASAEVRALVIKFGGTPVEA